MKSFLKNLLIVTVFLTSLSSCVLDEFHNKAMRQFDDQHFKTAIALIELHKVRFGEYPGSLQDLKYLGDWDAAIYQTLEYTKLDTGYELNIRANSDELSYPPEFFQGLGLKKTNVKKSL